MDNNDMENNESILIGDDRIVRVYIKIRDAIAQINDEYKQRLDHLKGQLGIAEAELLKRLHDRGATQTKTAAGTAFIAETMTVTIADEVAYGAFVLAEQDPTYYQKRAKVERVKEYMGAHDGVLPPGLSVFRQLNINVRQPRKVKNAAPTDDGGTDERSAE